MKCMICSGETTSPGALLFKCKDCSHLYRDVTINNSFYESGSYRKQHPPQDKIRREKWISNIISFLSDYLPSINTILEVGAGDGLFTQHLISLGKDVSSVELDPIISKNYTWKNFVGDYLSIDIKEVYDIVIALDVVEHFKHPDLFFKKTASKLLFIQVPTGRKVVSPKISKDTHYHYFTEKSIELLAEQNNFKLIKIFTSGKDFSANGPEMLCMFERLN